MENSTTSWSRHPGHSPALCNRCGERPPEKPRRICKPCRSAQVQERKKAELANPLGICTVAGCDRPRATTKNQRRTKCAEHYQARVRELSTRHRRALGKPERIINRPPEGTVIPAGSKWCNTCAGVKLITEFSACKSKKDGRQSKCKVCENDAYQRRLAADPDRVRALNRARTGRNIKMHLYGVARDVFDRVVVLQGGRCAICRLKKRLGVDHSHFLGHNRGVTCSPCNSGLGFFHDDPALLRAAADYLEADINRALTPGSPTLPIAFWVDQEA